MRKPVTPPVLVEEPEPTAADAQVRSDYADLRTVGGVVPVFLEPLERAADDDLDDPTIEMSMTKAPPGTDVDDPTTNLG